MQKESSSLQKLTLPVTNRKFRGEGRPEFVQFALSSIIMPYVLTTFRVGAIPFLNICFAYASSFNLITEFIQYARRQTIHQRCGRPRFNSFLCILILNSTYFTSAGAAIGNQLPHLKVHIFNYPMLGSDSCLLSFSLNNCFKGLVTRYIYDVLTALKTQVSTCSSSKTYAKCDHIVLCMSCIIAHLGLFGGGVSLDSIM